MAIDTQEHIDHIRRHFDAARTAWHDLREDSKQRYQYIEGDQWDADTVEKLTEENKPWLTCNIILPIILTILGERLDSLFDIKTIPFENGDERTAGVFNKMQKYFEYRSDLDYEYMQACADAIISDIGGCIERIWTNERDIRGEPIYQRVNPFYVYWDANAEKPDQSDATRIFKAPWATKEKIKELFPEKEEEIERELKIDKKTTMGALWTRLFGAKDAANYVDTKNNLFRIVEMQEKKYKKVKLLFDIETEETEELKIEGKALDLYLRMNPGKVIIEKPETEIWISTLVGGTLLVQEPTLADVQNGQFSLFPIWSYNFSGKPFGVVKNLKGYQDEHNKARTYALHILKTMANSGWIVHKDSDVDIEELELDGSKTGFILKWGGEGWQEPKKIQPNEPSAGMELMDQKALEGAWLTSGVSPNLRGREETAGESGKLFQSRVAQGLMILKPMFEMQSKSLKQIGQDMIDVVQNKMDYERTFRIVNQEDGTSEELIINQKTVFGVTNDVTKGKYDVIVIKADNSPTAKRQRFIEMYQMAGSMPQEFVRWDLIIENSEFENKHEWVEFIRNRMQLMGGAVQGQIAEGGQRQVPGGAGVRELVRNLPEEINKSVYLNR